MPFGQKLQILREQVALSQSALAEKAGLSLRSIQNWEQGHRVPKAHAIMAIAKALGVSVDDLLSELEAGTSRAKKPRKRARKK